MYAVVTQKNLISICIFYTIRHCIEHTWINHNDQFLFPNEGWKTDSEFFQGRNDKVKMNATSDDPIYTKLLSDLKDSLRALGDEIKPKVYEYGFLK